jgi:hypothetical protein
MSMDTPLQGCVSTGYTLKWVEARLEKILLDRGAALAVLRVEGKP